MTIRRYRAADRDAVIALFRGFMGELTPPQLQRPFAAYIETAISEELGRIDHYYFGREGQGFWVADDGGVVGMVGVECHTEEIAELRRMAVDARHRCRGIARALLGAAEEFCRGARYRTVILSTSELQTAARRLYESSGYRLLREQADEPASHKSAGAGLRRYHYEKTL